MGESKAAFTEGQAVTVSGTHCLQQCNCTQDADIEVRLSCVEALGRFGEDARPQLHRRSKGSLVGHLACACTALCASNSATALVKCLADESEMVWKEAFQALTKACNLLRKQVDTDP